MPQFQFEPIADDVRGWCIVHLSDDEPSVETYLHGADVEYLTLAEAEVKTEELITKFDESLTSRL